MTDERDSNQKKTFSTPVEEEPVWEGQIYTSEDGTRRILRRRPPILETEELYIQFGRRVVLRDINLQIRKGETVAVIGESGCGKTVLLKSLIGLIRPSFGRIYFDGNDLEELTERELSQVRTRYGFVFQQAALFDSMTIGDNIQFPVVQNNPKAKISELREMTVHLLHEVGLSSSVINRMPAELSGGMRKRVGFARALAMEPELMLYDEPTTGLDPIMSDVINELIISARDKHRVTGIIVTHDMKSAKKVADRIVMLYPCDRLGEDEPQIIFDGTPEEIDESEDPRVWQFVNGFAGERLMEMALAKQENEEGEDGPGDPEESLLSPEGEGESFSDEEETSSEGE